MDKNIRDLIKLMDNMITLMELKNKEDNRRKINRRRYNEKNCYHCGKIGHIRLELPFKSQMDIQIFENIRGVYSNHIRI